MKLLSLFTIPLVVLMIVPGVYGQEDDFFVITDDKIDLVLKAEDFVDKINEFAEWCDVNFNEQAPNCYFEFKEFVENNEEWIEGLDDYM